MWRDEAYLLDVLLAARKIQAFVAGVTRERFLADELLQNAIMHFIQIIGEAARLVSDEFQEAHPEVPWRSIIAMRNRLVHEYFRVQPKRVWAAVQDDVPALIPLLEPLVPPDEEA